MAATPEVRRADRDVLNAIFCVLRTGCQWRALEATGVCVGSTVHSRLQPGAGRRLGAPLVRCLAGRRQLGWALLRLAGPRRLAAQSAVGRGSWSSPGAGAGANWQAFKLTENTLGSLPPVAYAARAAQWAAGHDQRPCLDAGFDDAPVREVRAALGYLAHLRPRGEEAPQGGPASPALGRGAPGWPTCCRPLRTRWPKSSKTTSPSSALPGHAPPGIVAYLDRCLVISFRLFW